MEVGAKADPEFHPRLDVFLFVCALCVFVCLVWFALVLKSGLVAFFLLPPPTIPAGPGQGQS